MVGYLQYWPDSTKVQDSFECTWDMYCIGKFGKGHGA